jgi:phage N-6-adenine-methyltransferase
MNFRIDSEFERLIPPLKQEELESLKDSIIEDGCRDPLVVWEESGLLLDGHNRFRICTDNNISFNVKTKSLPDRESALDWIDRNQLGRRNLTPEQMSLLRGRRYNRLKRQDGGHGDQKSGGNFCTPNVAENLASQHGVSARTIKNDGQFANDIEKLKEIIPDIEQKIIAPDEKITKQEISIAAKISESHPEAAAAIITKYNHRALGTGENEWYTPIEHIEAVQDVLNGIDLDPASSKIAQETIKAGNFFTIEDDGLSKEWNGKIWLNPPYTQPDIKNFVVKLVEEFTSGNVTEAILLTHNYTDTSWFHTAASVCNSICFTRGRIAFINPDGKKAAPTQGQAFFYYGINTDKFHEVFSKFGLVLNR